MLADIFDRPPNGLLLPTYLMHSHFLQLIGFALREKIVEEDDIRRSTDVLNLDRRIEHRLTSLYYARSIFARPSLHR